MAAAPSAAIEPWPDDWFEQVDACLWCGGRDLCVVVEGVEDWFFAAVPGAFAFGRCGQCGSLVLLRRPVPERLGMAYRNYFTHRSARSGSLARRLWRVCAQGDARWRLAGSGSLLDRAGSLVVGLFPARQQAITEAHRGLPRAPARVLDYGCGNGDFLELGERLGHEVLGVDCDPEALAAARARGLCALAVDAIEEGAFAGRFDYITAAHVIEHVADPRALLARFRCWLKPGGRIFLEVPNAEAGGLSRYGRFWRGLEAPRHLSLPSLAGLRLALEHAGLAMVEVNERASGRKFMDEASLAAARAHCAQTWEAEPVGLVNGPEILIILAEPD